MRPAKDHFVVRIAGVDDRDAAAKLVNTDLFVPRERLPAIEEEDTWYHADLIGLDAVSETGVVLGKITALHNFRRRRSDRDRHHARRRSAAAAVHRCHRAGDRHRGEEGRRRAAERDGVSPHVARVRAHTISGNVSGPLGISPAGKALASGLWSLDAHDIRAHATDRHGTVDGTPAGGGPGMVMKPDVLARALDSIPADPRPRLLMSARGAPLRP